MWVARKRKRKKFAKFQLSERITISQFFSYIILHYIRLLNFILKFQVLMTFENLYIPLIEHMFFPSNWYFDIGILMSNLSIFYVFKSSSLIQFFPLSKVLCIYQKFIIIKKIFKQQNSYQQFLHFFTLAKFTPEYNSYVQYFIHFFLIF